MVRPTTLSLLLVALSFGCTPKPQVTAAPEPATPVSPVAPTVEKPKAPALKMRVRIVVLSPQANDYDKATTDVEEIVELGLDGEQVLERSGAGGQYKLRVTSQGGRVVVVVVSRGQLSKEQSISDLAPCDGWDEEAVVAVVAGTSKDSFMLHLGACTPVSK